MVFEGLFARARNGDRAVEATSEAVQPPERRPSIALALGGGAARGFAHIGVMRTLTKYGIVPDIIVGTSIGAVVGGCYAANQLDSLESWARSLTVRSVLGYSRSQFLGLRSHRRQKSHHPAEGCARRYADRKPALALCRHRHRIEYRARGLAHARPVVDALGASYALPGIFPPAHIGGRWLVDGALVNPVPVSAARALDARLVIAVNLNSDNFGRGTIIANHGPDANDETPAEPAKHAGLLGMFSGERSLRRQFLGRRGRPGISTVMIEAFNVMQDRITRAPACRRPAGCLHQSTPRPRRLVRFSSRRRGHRHRRRSDGKSHRRHRGSRHRPGASRQRQREVAGIIRRPQAVRI